MVSLFRKLRHRLLAENRLSRYILYAAGEILLVVIGILIALQINTWNEARKFKAQQYGLLTDLKTDLKANMGELKEGLQANTQFLDEYQGLKQAIEEDRAYSPAIDSLCLHLENWHSPFLARTAYESLKNIGLDIIENDSLKSQIITMYEKTFVYLSEDYDRSEWAFANNTKSDFLNEHFRYEKLNPGTGYQSFRYVPTDFDRLKADEGFLNMLSTMIVIRSRGIYHYSGTIATLQSLISDIERELTYIRV